MRVFDYKKEYTKLLSADIVSLLTAISENDSVAVSGTKPKSFQITYDGDIAHYTAEDVKAVILKTMDTGRSWKICMRRSMCRIRYT